MHRIDTVGSESGAFVDYDPTSGKAGTKVDAAIMNALQEELCNALEGFGITLVKGTNTQVRDLLKSSCQSVLTFGATALSVGSGNVSYVVPGWREISSDRCSLATPVAGVVRNLHINARAGSVGTTAFDQVVVLKNGVATDLAASLSTGATSASDTTHSFAVAAGDLIDVKVTHSGTGTTTPAYDVGVTVALTMG